LNNGGPISSAASSPGGNKQGRGRTPSTYRLMQGATQVKSINGNRSKNHQSSKARKKSASLHQVRKALPPPSRDDSQGREERDWWKVVKKNSDGEPLGNDLTLGTPKKKIASLKTKSVRRAYNKDPKTARKASGTLYIGTSRNNGKRKSFTASVAIHGSTTFRENGGACTKTRGQYIKTKFRGPQEGEAPSIPID